MAYSAAFVENKTIIILIRAFDLDDLSLEIIKSTHDVRNLTEGLLLKVLGGLVFSFGHRNRDGFIRHTLLIQHTNNALDAWYQVSIYLENHGYGFEVRCVMGSWERDVVCRVCYGPL